MGLAWRTVRKIAGFFCLAKRENRVDVKKLNAVVPDPGPPRPEGASSKASLEDCQRHDASIYARRTSSALRSVQGELDELNAVFVEIVKKPEESITLPGALEQISPPSNARAELHHPEEDACGSSYAMLCEDHSDY